MRHSNNTSMNNISIINNTSNINNNTSIINNTSSINTMPTCKVPRSKSHDSSTPIWQESSRDVVRLGYQP
jgi:hypothetical protein